MEVNPGIKRTAAMVVLKSGEQLLLLLRNKMPNKGLYVPVGGKLDPFERPIDAAIRETKEEAGIELSKDEIRFGGVLVESAPNDYNWQCYIYLAEIPYLPPPPCDEGILEWIDFERLADLPTPPTDWHIYQYLAKQKTFVMDALYDESMNLVEMKEELEGILLISKQELPI